MLNWESGSKADSCALRAGSHWRQNRKDKEPFVPQSLAQRNRNHKDNISFLSRFCSFRFHHLKSTVNWLIEIRGASRRINQKVPFGTFKIQLDNMRPRVHKQKKLNNHVYSFLLYVSSGPRYQVEFKYFKRSHYNAQKT